jgi:signal transduction histidine kinase
MSTIAADVINTTIDRGAHTVLVVDDNPATRYSTGRVIRAAGFRIAEAGSGAEALDLIATGVSAVVLDVHLPDIDGFEVCRMIRANPATSMLPVVHLSAEYMRAEDRIAGLNAGADAYLVHPAEPAVLIGTLQALIRARLAEDELRRVVEREKAARQVAEHYNRTKDDFIAVLSHELRTPLNAIVGWVHVLKRKGVTPEGVRGLEAIERNVKTQARLISDILDVSRINSGKLRLNREWTDPAQLVVDSIEALSPAITERRIQVEPDVESAHQPAWIDPARYQQIFWNLMTNAIKFSPEGGRVLVRLERAGDRLALTVQDFGQGIPPEFLPYLFDRFSQSDSPGNRRHGGLGLGMAIVKHLVDLHGGTATAESEGEGHGARVRVELPVQASADAEAEFADTEGGSEIGVLEATGLQGLQVLVVEDDPEASEMMNVVLSDRGVRVRIARDFDSAIDALQQAWPDVMVSDIGLPGRDGYELVRQVREFQRQRAGAHLPVIALTAFARPQDRQKTLEAGFDLHLAKPLKPHTLLEAIAHCRRPAPRT